MGHRINSPGAKAGPPGSLCNIGRFVIPPAHPPAQRGIAMAEKLEDLTLDFEEDGKVVRKTHDKAILSKGAWSTVAFLFSEADKKTGELTEPKVSIRRYKKQNDQYREQSKFTISSANQARQVVEVLSRWFPSEK
jgi:hypothetical protein